jgi:hypothetical protein
MGIGATPCLSRLKPHSVAGFNSNKMNMNLISDVAGVGVELPLLPPLPQHHPNPKLVHVLTFNDDISLLLGAASSWKKRRTQELKRRGRRQRREF